MRLQLTLASLACALTLGAARADEIIDSSYTTHDYEKCREGKPVYRGGAISTSSARIVRLAPSSPGAQTVRMPRGEGGTRNSSAPANASGTPTTDARRTSLRGSTARARRGSKRRSIRAR